MYNSRNIIIGLVIFAALFTYPFWNAFGSESVAPQPAIPALAQEGQPQECVEATEYMRSNHMELLIEWKDDVQRHGERTYVNTNGEAFNNSLQNTCLDCHSNKAEFCDQCHSYAGVDPVCWTCHVDQEVDV